jgi:beta-ribofuranosylaminobenzene 5'-phosphate synthase
MRVTLSVPARIHLTLIELGSNGYRRNGGLGFALNGLSRRLCFDPASRLNLETLAKLGFTQGDIDEISTLLCTVSQQYHFTEALHLRNAEGPGRHLGTGSGTAIALACVESLFKVNGTAVEQQTLVQLSGRGGTSGVGIETYFTGGFVLDVGRTYDATPIVSSDDIKYPSKLPEVLYRTPMPDWPIGIMLPDISSLTLEQERAVFHTLQSAPLSATSIQEAAYHSVFGIAAAVMSKDYVSFCNAVNAIQDTEWKAREIAAYKSDLRSTMNRMRVLGSDCVGLSSMGPALFFLSRDMHAVVTKLRTEFPAAGIHVASMNNTGREINYA